MIIDLLNISFRQTSQSDVRDVFSQWNYKLGFYGIKIKKMTSGINNMSIKFYFIILFVFKDEIKLQCLRNKFLIENYMCVFVFCLDETISKWPNEP